MKAPRGIINNTIFSFDAMLLFGHKLHLKTEYSTYINMQITQSPINKTCKYVRQNKAFVSHIYEVFIYIYTFLQYNVSYVFQTMYLVHFGQLTFKI